MRASVRQRSEVLFRRQRHFTDIHYKTYFVNNWVDDKTFNIYDLWQESKD